MGLTAEGFVSKAPLRSRMENTILWEYCDVWGEPLILLKRSQRPPLGVPNTAYLEWLWEERFFTFS